MDPTQYWLIVAFTLGGGLFTVAGAWKDWDFFMENGGPASLSASSADRAHGSSMASSARPSWPGGSWCS